MSNDNAGRSSRTTSGNGPVGSTVAIVVTAIALILGFLILRKMNDDPAASSNTTASATTTTLGSGSTTSSVAASTTTTEPPLVTTGTKVQAVNCSTQNKAAAFLATTLSGVGFVSADPASCSPTQAKLATTLILYDADDANAQAVAESVGRALGNKTVEARSNPVPNEAGVYPEGTGVIVLIGDDIANKTLNEIAGKATTGVTVAPVST